MIRNRQFIWKQLNGPQIEAVMQSLFDRCVDMYDSKFEYFDTLSIDTAKNKHLSLIGKLMMFQRPSIISEEEFNLWFQFSDISSGEDPPKEPYGFDGGRFYWDTEDEGFNYSELDDEVYRQILVELGKVDGFSRGLNFIDRMAYTLFVTQEEEPIYYEILTDINKYGDILVKVKSNPNYRLVVFDKIMEHIFRGQPRVSYIIDSTIGSGE